jgi:hypothetical protein
MIFDKYSSGRMQFSGFGQQAAAEITVKQNRDRQRVEGREACLREPSLPEGRHIHKPSERGVKRRSGEVATTTHTGVWRCTSKPEPGYNAASPVLVLSEVELGWVPLLVLLIQL